MMLRKMLPRKWLIVALVFVVLLLSIGIYISSQLRASDNRWEDMENPVSMQIRSGMTTSGELLVLDKSLMELQRGKEMRYYFGLKNMYPEAKSFFFVLRCNEKQNEKSRTPCNSTVYGGFGAETEWFKLFPTTLEAGEIKVIPFEGVVLADYDTYEFRFEVYAGGPDMSSASRCTSETSKVPLRRETTWNTSRARPSM